MGENIDRLYDTAIERKEIFPLWLFTDLYRGRHTGYKFMCFIGANVPMKLFNTDERIHKEQVEELKTGVWKTERLNKLKESGQEPKKIGWGFGNTPSQAFREACYMSGHINRDTVVQGS